MQSSTNIHQDISYNSFSSYKRKKEKLAEHNNLLQVFC